MYPTEILDRNRLVEKHVPLVKRIAYHLLGRLPADVQVDDLIQAGVIGLLEAARLYDASQGASFETYAGIRIRGAMLDEVRRSDWTPRSVHRNARRVSEAVRAVEHREGREAQPQEVAAELDVGLDEYQRMVSDAVSSRVLSFEDIFEPESEGENRLPGSEPDPLERLQDEGFREALAGEIDRLPEREKLVMSLYYDDELNLREIGEVLGVSESRVCQLHGQALVRLRARMTDWTGRVAEA
ncbi:RNA polymerase sigma factor FliA [Thioalkalivibrio sp.]|uniref:RNA polymerase sigma factor FliA n=1 Tax=Thioalkalivibrio sp. TaxID=2093813 RepID=UPI0012D5B17A|nr:RNA polymerase sigma factor FliA [Thioalkalivibrio sp.]TVP81615.1 MAG: RNA polymerase sigma factor FliA [Thioalkalivibrio sp.]